MNIDKFCTNGRETIEINYKHVSNWKKNTPPDDFILNAKPVKILDCNVTNALLKKISKTWGDQITNLAIVQCTGKIDLKGCRFSSLRRFELGVTDNHCEAIFKQLEKMSGVLLEEISIWNCEKIAKIDATFPHLHTLSLQNTAFDDEGLKELSRRQGKTLKNLEITMSKVSKAERLEPFSKLTKLEVILTPLEETPNLLERLRQKPLEKEPTKQPLSFWQKIAKLLRLR